jgi:hypothetical protein
MRLWRLRDLRGRTVCLAGPQRQARQQKHQLKQGPAYRSGHPHPGILPSASLSAPVRIFRPAAVLFRYRSIRLHFGSDAKLREKVTPANLEEALLWLNLAVFRLDPLVNPY